jgi:DNA-directed RNA polymerase specialized sigma24 family protein
MTDHDPEEENDPEEHDPAGRAARQLLAGGPIDPNDYRALRRRVLNYLLSLDTEFADAEDITDAALVRGLDAGLQLHQVRRPIAYILQIARNTRSDRFRRNREVPVDPDSIGDWSENTDDDSLLRLLNQGLSLEMVRAALQLASRQNDMTCLHVVQTWLDLAAKRDRTPSSRDVAMALGVAHTTVQRALGRFRGYVLRVQRRSDR